MAGIRYNPEFINDLIEIQKTKDLLKKQELDLQEKEDALALETLCCVRDGNGDLRPSRKRKWATIRRLITEQDYSNRKWDNLMEEMGYEKIRTRKETAEHFIPKADIKKLDSKDITNRLVSIIFDYREDLPNGVYLTSNELLSELHSRIPEDRKESPILPSPEIQDDLMNFQIPLSAYNRMMHYNPDFNFEDFIYSLGESELNPNERDEYIRVKFNELLQTLEIEDEDESIFDEA